MEGSVVPLYPLCMFMEESSFSCEVGLFVVSSYFVL
jgi:hypothetical protein